MNNDNNRIVIRDGIKFRNLFPYHCYLNPGAYWWTKDGSYKQLVEVFFNGQNLLALSPGSHTAIVVEKMNGYWSEELR